MDRLKLETAIERETYRLVEQIREHMYDLPAKESGGC